MRQISKTRIWIVLLCSMVSIYMLAAYSSSKLLFISTLPLSFVLLSLIFKDLYRVGIINYVILGFCIMRYVVTPLLIIMTNNTNVFRNSLSDLKMATLFMIYDLIILFFGVTVYYHSKQGYGSLKKYRNKINFEENRIGILLIICVIFIVLLYLAMPEARDMFKNILGLTDETFTWDGTYQVSGNFSGLKRILLTIFTLIFRVVRILFPLYLITLLQESTIGNYVKLIVSLLFIATQFLFITSTIAESFICAGVLVYFLCILYPRERKFITVTMLISMIVIFVLLMSFRYSLDNNQYANGNGVPGYLSSVVNSYFPGVNSVAASMRVNLEKPVASFFTTISYSVPFNTTLFGVRGESYSQMFNYFNATSGQIPPSLGMGISYTNWIIAPLFSAAFGITAIHYGEKIYVANSIQKQCCYLLLALYLATAVGIYNFQIATTYVLNLVIFMMIVVFLNSRIKNKYRFVIRRGNKWNK